MRDNCGGVDGRLFRWRSAEGLRGDHYHVATRQLAVCWTEVRAGGVSRRLVPLYAASSCRREVAPALVGTRVDLRGHRHAREKFRTEVRRALAVDGSTVDCISQWWRVRQTITTRKKDCSRPSALWFLSRGLSRVIIRLVYHFRNTGTTSQDAIRLLDTGKGYNPFRSP